MDISIHGTTSMRPTSTAQNCPHYENSNAVYFEVCSYGNWYGAFNIYGLSRQQADILHGALVAIDRLAEQEDAE